MNLIFWSSESDDDRRDTQVGSWLGELDPGRDDATYWMRFHRDVVDGSRFELARRRQAAELTVVGVVSSWSRTLVPVALAAAAAAGIMLAQPRLDQVEPPILVEDVLTMGLGDPMPALFVDDEEGGLLLASEIY
ncbi:MAG: hypothetical protein JSU98_13465 [Gemmatimonadales bacterium]|jgi:hypothetical protein|nr:MAG: hypothetical protein JSU98_13465 [Gemmatimonadales bacterium]